MPMLRAVIAIFLLLINMIIIAASILILFCLIHLLPSRSWRLSGQAWLQQWPVWWMDVNYWILQLSTYKKWHIEGDAALNTKHWYLLISNHQSWMDILVLGIFFRHRIPILKFFMKKELLWSLPVAGWACYVLGYPFMARHSHEEIRKNPLLKTKDIETTRAACAQFKKFPTTVVNFVEGTRFTTAKQQAQQSPYRHLLNPKATGVALVTQELGAQLSGIINVTLHYTPQRLSLWQFLCGRIEKIYLHYELLPLTPDLIGDPYTDRTFRKHFQHWLNELWQLKDQRLEKFSGQSS
jgi:1-acyl-sn-glycerol-3-phosphate acyltransferase